MKKAIIAIIAIAGLSLGYICYSICCPPDCCKGQTECSSKATTANATLEVK